MNKDVIELISIILGGGGIAGAMVALFKVRPEAARISVDAAQGAVVVQASVITALRDENERLRKHCEETDKENEHLRDMLNGIDERKKREGTK